MKLSKKIQCLILAVCMLLSILPITVLAVDYTAEYDLGSGSVTIDADGIYRIYQSGSDATTNTISVNSDCTIYLDGVNILVPSPSKTGDYSRPNPFNINGPYKVTVYLVDGSVNTLASAEGYYNSDTFQDDNRLRCGSGRAAIGVPAGAELIINGSDGVLNAYGANGHNISAGTAHAGGGAGIGGDGAYANSYGSNAEASGKVTVNGGVINAVGGNSRSYWGGGGAGIGGGGGKYKESGGSSDSIIINGGTVNATGGEGSYGRNGNALGSGATGAKGSLDYASTAPIEINGGTVTIKRFQKNNAGETITVGKDGVLIIGSGTDINIKGEVINYGSVLCSEHSIKAVEAKDPTCTEDGNIAHYKCNVCGTLFSDEEGKTEVAYEDVAITALPHSLVKTDRQEETCTEDGNIEYYTCSVCNKLFADEEATTEITLDDTVIPASHSLVKIDRNEATCTEDGNIEYYTCSVCDKLFADEEATTEITLEDTVIPASHSLEHVEGIEATCTEDGNIEYFTCSVCDKLFADEEATTEITLEDTVIPASHSLEHVEGIEATCTEDGNIEYFTCSVCDKLFADEEATTEITLEDTVITAKGHSYDSVVTPPTCTEAGYTTHTCANCGDSYVDSEVPATGHSYKDGRCVNCGSDDPATIHPGGPADEECHCIFCSINRWCNAFIRSCIIWLTNTPVSIGEWFAGVINNIITAIK